MAFVKAERKKVPLKIALNGASGSGKTMGALKLAKGLGGKIAFIDTENGSASLYAHLADFDVLDMAKPYDARKFVDGIKQAEDGGYNVLVIDSYSHAWVGEGGVLDKKQALDQNNKGSNSYTNWAVANKDHESLKNAFLQSPLHIICCMRTKQSYVLEPNEKGKLVPVKKGMEPIQREGMEYEFTVVFEVDNTHHFSVNKDRTDLFLNRREILDENHGKELLAWLNSGKELLPEKIEVKKISEGQRKSLFEILKSKGFNSEEMQTFLGTLGYKNSKDIPEDKFDIVFNAAVGLKVNGSEAVKELTEAV